MTYIVITAMAASGFLPGLEPDFGSGAWIQVRYLGIQKCNGERGLAMQREVDQAMRNFGMQGVQIRCQELKWPTT